MASINKAVKTPASRTHEGAIAARINKEQELRRAVLSTLLWEDTFYESGVEIGQRIREVRRRNNMSQAEVADYLGCSRIKVNRVENGLTDFSVVELELLAQHFNVTILHFLGIELTVSVRGSERQFSVPV